MTNRVIADIPFNKKIVTKNNRSWVAVDRENSTHKFPLLCEIHADKKGRNYIWFKGNTYYFQGGTRQCQ